MAWPWAIIKMVKRIKGIPASPGIAIGRTLLYNESPTAIPRFYVSREEVQNEVERLKKAVSNAAEEIQVIKESLDDDARGSACSP